MTELMSGKFVPGDMVPRLKTWSEEIQSLYVHPGSSGIQKRQDGGMKPLACPNKTGIWVQLWLWEIAILDHHHQHFWKHNYA